jgi:hypothetical protein
MTGAWEILGNMQACNLPQDVATGFMEVANGMIGVTYVPVLYCATQIVNGKNHMIICTQTVSSNPAKESIVEMVLHQATDGTFSILSIKSIL